VITLGSVFSGIGGLELGLERAGFQVKWQVEYEDYCNKILAKHWPGVKRYGDIYNVRGSELEKVDCICGGFPCQPFSTAGKRKGTADSRWLWPEFYRIICEVRPRWVIVENVPGLLSIDSGRVFAGILRDIAATGYDAEWRIVSAKDVGARHLRKRLFVIGYVRDTEGAGKLTENGQTNQGSNSNAKRVCQDGYVANTDDTEAARRRENSGESIPKPEAIRFSDGSIFNNGILEALRIRNTGPGGIWHSDPADIPDTDQGRRSSGLRQEGITGPCAEAPGPEFGGNNPEPNLSDCPGNLQGHGNDGNAAPLGYRTESGASGSAIQTGEWGAIKSGLGRVASRFSEWLDYTPRVGLKIPDRVNRLKCLGNAVVPEVSEFIGLCIMDSGKKGA
jgi:site-specific DNA-cytosine methylase